MYNINFIPSLIAYYFCKISFIYLNYQYIFHPFNFQSIPFIHLNINSVINFMLLIFKFSINFIHSFISSSISFIHFKINVLNSIVPKSTHAECNNIECSNILWFGDTSRFNRAVELAIMPPCILCNTNWIIRNRWLGFIWIVRWLWQSTNIWWRAFHASAPRTTIIAPGRFICAAPSRKTPAGTCAKSTATPWSPKSASSTSSVLTHCFIYLKIPHWWPKQTHKCSWHKVNAIQFNELITIQVWWRP